MDVVYKEIAFRGLKRFLKAKGIKVKLEGYRPKDRFFYIAKPEHIGIIGGVQLLSKHS